MRRDRRPVPPFVRYTHGEPEPTWWERGFVYLEFFGFGMLVVSGIVATVWGALRYIEGWS